MCCDDPTKDCQPTLASKQSNKPFVFYRNISYHTSVNKAVNFSLYKSLLFSMTINAIVKNKKTIIHDQK